MSLQIVNFRFIPVAHQLNFCLAVSLVWATILSVIRASEASHIKEIESIDTISITNYSGPWRKKEERKKNPLRKFSRLSSVVPLLLSRCWLSMRLAMLQFMVSPYEAGWAEYVFEEVACVADAWK